MRGDCQTAPLTPLCCLLLDSAACSSALLLTHIRAVCQSIPDTRLLCSGFWGLSRHVNYLGEIVQATALALPGALLATTSYYQALAWLYPLYCIPSAAQTLDHPRGGSHTRSAPCSVRSLLLACHVPLL